MALIVGIVAGVMTLHIFVDQDLKFVSEISLTEIFNL